MPAGTEWPPPELLIAYYDELYSQNDRVQAVAKAGRSLFVRHGREFVRLIEALPTGGRALEIGCGTGELAGFLRSRFESVAGTEISRVALEEATRRYPDVEFRLVRDMTLPFPDASFDVVVSDQVIEHIYPSENPTYFSEIARVLKPGGRALVATPNGGELRRRVLWTPVRWLAMLLRRPEGYVASHLYWIQDRVLSVSTVKAKLFRKYRMLEHTNILAPGQLRGHAEGAGLRVVELRFDGIRPLFPRLLARMGVVGPLEHLEASMRRGRSLAMSNMIVVLERVGPAGTPEPSPIAAAGSRTRH